jgi:hypothetical protein
MIRILTLDNAKTQGVIKARNEDAKHSLPIVDETDPPNAL